MQFSFLKYPLERLVLDADYDLGPQFSNYTHLGKLFNLSRPQFILL